MDDLLWRILVVETFGQLRSLTEDFRAPEDTFRGFLDHLGAF